MEYQQFAKYYDLFYLKKDYIKEINFLCHFISDNASILDIGCGTGRHGQLLEERGYQVDGLDLNKEMLNIAAARIHGQLYYQNILKAHINKKYHIIISMFAVLNHLKNTDELKMALQKMKDLLLPNGRIMIDLHNPQSSGEKTEIYENIKRTMKWDYNIQTKFEKTKITYEINGKKFKTGHTFRIFTIEEIKTCCNEIGLNVKQVFENYDINKCGSIKSKNLQFLIEK